MVHVWNFADGGLSITDGPRRESSNVGEAAERSDVTPTRQFWSRMRGEPRLVASKTARSDRWSSELRSRLPWLRVLEEGG